MRFSAFEVNFESRELFKHGTRIKIQKQPFEILRMLLERPGTIVSREELRQRLWPDNTFVEYEDSLNTAVRKLRAVLSDSSDLPRYVETVARQGYRFIAPVQVASVAASQVAANVETATATRTDPAARSVTSRTGSHRRLLILSLLLLAGLGVIFAFPRIRTADSRWWNSSASSQPPVGKLMLAVLPFENLTGDPAQEYFSDGLTEEMNTQLGRLDPGHLGVIARTSIMHYKNSPESLDQIGRELGVQYVLEGSVRRDANKVRITAQLIQMKDQTRIWSREYDRELSSLLTLQGEIAQEIADGIQRTLGDNHRSAPATQASLATTDYEAFDFYLKGRYFWNKRSAEGFQRAVECFQQAIAKDPNYARAYAGLADSYAMIGSYSFASPTEVMPKARAAAVRALEIDERLAEAHTSLALITENYDWDWQGAEREYRRSIQLDPNYATAHHWYAEFLAFQGRFDEALTEIERARRLDPLSLIIASDKGAILYFSRQPDKAIEQFRAVLDMEPSFGRAQLVVYSYVQKGRYWDALRHIENWRRIDDTPWTWSAEAYVLGRSGQPVKARHALEELKVAMTRHPGLGPAVMFAQAYAGMNNKDLAIAALERAYAEHTSALTDLKVDPIYDPLRSDPRFQDLLRRVHLDK